MTETQREDPARTDTARTDTARTDTARSDTARTDDSARLARALTDLVDAARRDLGGRPSALVDRVTDHIGCPLAQVPTVALSLPSWEHADLQAGVDAYLASHTPNAEWFGIGGGGRGHQDIVDMLTATAQHGHFQLGAVDYATVAVGPDRVAEAVELGLVATTAPDGQPVVLGVRGPGAGGDTCELRVLAADRATATAARDEVERLVRLHDVFRGAVLSFDVSEYRHNQMVSFLPRADLTRDDVVLPAGVLDAVEQHVVRTPEQTARLVAHGQHLKRGLLLHGPPGTGKTHTVRYLISRLRSSTVVVLSGRALHMLPAASALVRRSAPSVLVIEDVDLIAEDRSTHASSPMLFELLNRIDGVDADADVTFVLTTNRVATMERALVDRPGRVDLAIEVPLPDAAARERLLRLYARDLPIDLAPDSEVLAATDGVTASFMRELVRRAVLRALAADPNAPVVLDGELLAATLAELSEQRSALTRAMLGGVTRPAPCPP